MKTSAPHEQLVINELEELELNLEKLSFFMDGSTFQQLPIVDQSLLIAQLGIMEAYINILETRVALFTSSTLAN
tara:strand:+ start:1698 stop:1919 length:222 start_codon:yes stop_codon:yes gene_type:complete